MFPQKRPDMLTHVVRREPLAVTVVEKGQLESADNRDVVCKVKAGSKGTFASSIKWVIDDGSMVTKGQLLMQLDDSSLQDQRANQSIVVDRARADFIKADEDYRITVKDNEALIADAESKLAVAALDLDKFIGFRAEPALDPFGAVIGMPATLSERGEFQRQLDEVSATLKAAESDLDALRERSAWANRSAKLGYLTPTQARAEETKSLGAKDKVGQLQQQRFILTNFTRQREVTNLRSALEVARIGFEKAVLQSKAKEIQADIERRTRQSILLQEQEKLKEIDDQIAECRLHAPQDGMVVYYKPESSRFNSGSTTGMIAQGEQVREGQKLMRIPDLRKMQVNTKVHEAQVARIRGDDRRATGMFDLVRTGTLLPPDPMVRLIGQSEWALDQVREQVRDKEYRLESKGQRATVRVDAYPDRVFSGRVRSVAAVASAADWMASDVKVYQTLVLIEETVDGLKPDMNAEVTIHVDDSTEPVLTVPIQAVIGGAEAGPKREVFVLVPGSEPERREVTLGKFNDKMIEVRSGLNEGDVVLTNPKVMLGTAAKTREEGDLGSPRGTNKSAPGGEGGEKKGKGGGKGKGGPGGAGGPPKGGPQG
jgi:multidrug efflux pump subunit AcrA (membrane-fusion protein)